MRYLLFVYCFITVGFYTNGQITIRTNFPEQLAPNVEFLLEVKIQKGVIKNFSKYQLVVPQGIEINEVDSKTGTFTFENNRAQIIWAITPPENELVVTMKFLTGNSTGEKTLNQKFFFLEKGEKREIETQDIILNIVDSAASKELVPSEKEFVKNDLVNVTRDTLIDNPEEVKQQISQLRKDSKEAYEIGGREKRNAEARIADADKAIKAASGIKNPKDKKAATERAMANKSLAQNDLEVAARILSLARSLEENATEIEKLNQSIDSIGVGEYTPSNPTQANTITENVKPHDTPKVNPASLEKDKKSALTSGEKNAKGLYKPYSANNQNLGEIQQQVMQIKRDSRQAYEVGQSEKKKAEQNLAKAHEALKLAGYMPEVEEKKIAIDKANADKQKAEKDLEIAAKILALAKSLENNANDISSLNLPPETKTPAAGNATSTAKASPEGIVELNPTKKEETPVNTPKKETPVNQPKKEVPKKQEQVVDSGAGVASEKGLVFRIQIGSFNNTPDKDQFRSLGKVEVIKEGGMFKALYGNFATKEEAIKKRAEVISKGFDGFVVSYQDGVRVK